MGARHSKKKGLNKKTLQENIKESLAATAVRMESIMRVPIEKSKNVPLLNETYDYIIQFIEDQYKSFLPFSKKSPRVSTTLEFLFSASSTTSISRLVRTFQISQRSPSKHDLQKLNVIYHMIVFDRYFEMNLKLQVVQYAQSELNGEERIDEKSLAAQAESKKKLLVKWKRFLIRILSQEKHYAFHGIASQFERIMSKAFATGTTTTTTRQEEKNLTNPKSTISQMKSQKIPLTVPEAKFVLFSFQTISSILINLLYILNHKIHSKINECFSQELATSELEEDIFCGSIAELWLMKGKNRVLFRSASDVLLKDAQIKRGFDLEFQDSILSNFLQERSNLKSSMMNPTNNMSFLQRDRVQLQGGVSLLKQQSQQQTISYDVTTTRSMSGMNNKSGSFIESCPGNSNNNNNQTGSSTATTITTTTTTNTNVGNAKISISFISPISTRNNFNRVSESANNKRQLDSIQEIQDKNGHDSSVSGPNTESENGDKDSTSIIQQEKREGKQYQGKYFDDDDDEEEEEEVVEKQKQQFVVGGGETANDNESSNSNSMEYFKQDTQESAVAVAQPFNQQQQQQQQVYVDDSIYGLEHVLYTEQQEEESRVGYGLNPFQQQYQFGMSEFVRENRSEDGNRANNNNNNYNNTFCCEERESYKGNTRSSMVRMREHLTDRFQSYMLRLYGTITSILSLESEFKQLKKAVHFVRWVKQWFRQQSVSEIEAHDFITSKDSLHEILLIVFKSYLKLNPEYTARLFRLLNAVMLLPLEKLERTELNEVSELLKIIFNLDQIATTSTLIRSERQFIDEFTASRDINPQFSPAQLLPSSSSTADI